MAATAPYPCGRGPAHHLARDELPKKRAHRNRTTPVPADPASSPPPRAAGEPPPPDYEEPGARNPDRQRVEGMSIDPKLEDSAGAPTRPRRE